MVGARSVALAASTFFRAWCPLQPAGVANIPNGPVIICANHRSHLDGTAVGLATGRPPANIAFFVAADYFFAPGAWLPRMPLPCRLIPVDRTHPLRGMADLDAGARQALADGSDTLVVFPEGTRAVGTTTRPFRRGAALLAASLNIPLIPARIDGTETALPRGRAMPTPCPIRVQFGSPLIPPRDGVSPAAQSHWSKDATRVLEREIAAMGLGRHQG